MVMIFAIFPNYRVHSIHIGQRAMAQQHYPKLSKITDHDFLLPLADFLLYVTCFVFIKNPRAQRIMSEHFVLIIINRNKNSLRIVNIDDFRIFYKLSCSFKSYSPATSALVDSRGSSISQLFFQISQFFLLFSCSSESYYSAAN